LSRLSATGRSLASNIFSKTKMALERAKKLSDIWSNNDSGGTGADEVVALSLADVVIEDEEEAEEWRVEKESLSEMCWK